MIMPIFASVGTQSAKYRINYELLSPSLFRLRFCRLGNKGAPEVPTACHIHHSPESSFHSRSNLGMEGYGRPGGSRLGGLVVGVGVELVRLGVEPPDEEESGDGGGEEDEDDPQRAHL